MCQEPFGTFHGLIHLILLTPWRGTAIAYIWKLICQDGVSHKQYAEIQIGRSGSKAKLLTCLL